MKENGLSKNILNKSMIMKIAYNSKFFKKIQFPHPNTFSGNFQLFEIDVEQRIKKTHVFIESLNAITLLKVGFIYTHLYQMLAKIFIKFAITPMRLSSIILSKRLLLQMVLQPGLTLENGVKFLNFLLLITKCFIDTFF